MSGLLTTPRDHNFYSNQNFFQRQKEGNDILRNTVTKNLIVFILTHVTSLYLTTYTENNDIKKRKDLIVLLLVNLTLFISKLKVENIGRSKNSWIIFVQCFLWSSKKEIYVHMWHVRDMNCLILMIVQMSALIFSGLALYNIKIDNKIIANFF